MERFSLKNKKVVITGGTGMLGIQHSYAVAEAGGFPILFDIDEAKYKSMQKSLADIPHEFICVDITKKKRVQESLCTIKQKGMSVDVLINNAALNPKIIPPSICAITPSGLITVPQSIAHHTSWTLGFPFTIDTLAI